MSNVGDWIKENCLTVGGGPLDVSRFDNAHARFQDSIPAGDVWYSIQDGLNREAGKGTFDGVNVIARTVVHSTLVDGIFDDVAPIPITLSGASIVSCTLNKDAWVILGDHPPRIDNPHQVTKDQVGLGNVDNTSDLAKPISDATQVALNLKADQSDLNIVIEDLDILELDVSYREAVVTGLELGGAISQDGPTAILVTAGAGEINDSYTDPRIMDAYNINWQEQSFDLLANLGMPKVAGLGVTIIGITVDPGDPTKGVIEAFPNDMTAKQRRDSVYLGIVEYFDQSITNIVYTPIVSNQVGNTLYDLLDYIDAESRLKGLLTRPTNIGDLTIWRDSGTIFNVGINYINDKSNQNIRVIAALGAVDTPVSFIPVRYNNGNTLSSAAETQVPNLIYEDGGNGGLDAIGNTKAVIHYLYQSIGGDIFLSYGQTEYGDFAEAQTNLYADNVIRSVPIELDEMILLAQMIVAKSTITWDNIGAAIYPIGSSVASTSGSSVATQAVDIEYTDTFAIGGNVQVALDSLAALKLTNDQNDAIDAANAPSAANPLATIDDISSTKDTTKEVIDEAAMLAMLGVVQGDVTVLTTESLTYKNVTGDNLTIADWQLLKSASLLGASNDTSQEVADIAAMLALGVIKQGDVVVTTATSQTYKNIAGLNTVIGDWQLLKASVAGSNIDGGTAPAVNNIIQIRRDTAVDWAAANPILSEGEIGYELDTEKKKIGDGATIWASLPYDAFDLVDDLTPQLGGDLDANLHTFDNTSYRQIANATPGASYTIDYSLGDMVQVTVTEAITFSVSNFVVGKVCVFILELVNGGAFANIFPVGWRFEGQTQPIFTAAGTDMILITKDMNEVYTVIIIGEDVG